MAYAPKQILRQEPAAVTTVLNLWLAFAILVGWISWSADTVTAFVAAANSTLLILYVRPLVTSRSALSELAAADDST